MDPDTRDSLAWGLVGGLSFLVLVQGYELVTAQAVAALVKLVGVVVVTALSTASVVLTRRRLPEPAESSEPDGAADPDDPSETIETQNEGSPEAESGTNERT